MPAPPIVDFRDVAKRYGDGPLVLERISFGAQPRDFISLIGPSGCGKSTALRLLAGLSPISSGTLTIDGRPPTDAAAELAFVFQEPTLLPWLTVAHNVEVPQQLRGIAPAEPSILLLHVHGRPLGFLVDQVHDLIHVPPSALEDRGTLPGVDPRVVSAVGRWEELVFVVLDPDVVLAPVFVAGEKGR